MSDLPPVRRAMRHWLEYVSTAVAVIVSLVSLWVAIGSENANRQMVAASSWPILGVGGGNLGSNGEAIISLEVVNSGVGPAKIRSFEVFYKGMPMASTATLMHACCDRSFKEQSPEAPQALKTAMVTGKIAGTVIRAGESVAFIRYALGSDNAAAWHALDKARKHDIKYRICYCSVFDECWINDTKNHDQLDPTPGSLCPVPKAPYTE